MMEDRAGQMPAPATRRHFKPQGYRKAQALIRLMRSTDGSVYECLRPVLLDKDNKLVKVLMGNGKHMKKGSEGQGSGTEKKEGDVPKPDVLQARVDYVPHLRIVSVKKLVNGSIKKWTNDEVQTPKVAVPLCDSCGMQFKTQLKLNYHKSDHDRTEFLCEKCDSTLFSKYELDEHMLTHGYDAAGPHCCKLCDFTYAFAYGLETHMKLHEQQKAWECNICGKLFKGLGSQARHKLTHSEPQFPCKLCDKRFYDTSGLKKHLYWHKGETQYLCDLCGKAFLTRNQFDHHKNRHNSVLYKCRFCSKLYKHRDTCRTHELSHTGEKPCMCEICGKIFQGIIACNSHKSTHAPDRFPCDVCGRTFSRAKFLQNHMKSHSANISRKCGMCDETFLTKHAMRKHRIKQHRPDNPYTCEDCGACFTSRKSLQKHQSRHKPPMYRCDICGMKIRHLTTLNTHRFAHFQKKNASEGAQPPDEHLYERITSSNITPNNLLEYNCSDVLNVFDAPPDNVKILFADERVADQAEDNPNIASDVPQVQVKPKFNIVSKTHRTQIPKTKTRTDELFECVTAPGGFDEPEPVNVPSKLVVYMDHQYSAELRPDKVTKTSSALPYTIEMCGTKTVVPVSVNDAFTSNNTYSNTKRSITTINTIENSMPSLDEIFEPDVTSLPDSGNTNDASYQSIINEIFGPDTTTSNDVNKPSIIAELDNAPKPVQTPILHKQLMLKVPVKSPLDEKLISNTKEINQVTKLDQKKTTLAVDQLIPDLRATELISAKDISTLPTARVLYKLDTEKSKRLLNKTDHMSAADLPSSSSDKRKSINYKQKIEQLMKLPYNKAVEQISKLPADKPVGYKFKIDQLTKSASKQDPILEADVDDPLSEPSMDDSISKPPSTSINHKETPILSTTKNKPFNFNNKINLPSDSVSPAFNTNFNFPPNLPMLSKISAISKAAINKTFTEAPSGGVSPAFSTNFNFASSDLEDTPKFSPATEQIVNIVYREISTMYAHNKSPDVSSNVETAKKIFDEFSKLPFSQRELDRSFLQLTRLMEREKSKRVNGIKVKRLNDKPRKTFTHSKISSTSSTHISTDRKKNNLPKVSTASVLPAFNMNFNFDSKLPPTSAAEVSKLPSTSAAAVSKLPSTSAAEVSKAASDTKKSKAVLKTPTATTRAAKLSSDAETASKIPSASVLSTFNMPSTSAKVSSDTKKSKPPSSSSTKVSKLSSNGTKLPTIIDLTTSSSEGEESETTNILTKLRSAIAVKISQPPSDGKKSVSGIDLSKLSSALSSKMNCKVDSTRPFTKSKVTISRLLSGVNKSKAVIKTPSVTPAFNANFNFDSNLLLPNAPEASKSSSEKKSKTVSKIPSVVLPAFSMNFNFDSATVDNEPKVPSPTTGVSILSASKLASTNSSLSTISPTSDLTKPVVESKLSASKLASTNSSLSTISPTSDLTKSVVESKLSSRLKKTKAKKKLRMKKSREFKKTLEALLKLAATNKFMPVNSEKKKPTSGLFASKPGSASFAAESTPGTIKDFSDLSKLSTKEISLPSTVLFDSKLPTSSLTVNVAKVTSANTKTSKLSSNTDLKFGTNLKIAAMQNNLIFAENINDLLNEDLRTGNSNVGERDVTQPMTTDKAVSATRKDGEFSDILQTAISDVLEDDLLGTSQSLPTDTNVPMDKASIEYSDCMTHIENMHDYAKPTTMADPTTEPIQIDEINPDSDIKQRLINILKSAHICPHCHKMFVNLNTLEFHELSPKVSSFSCQRCNIQFVYRLNYEAHIAKHETMCKDEQLNTKNKHQNHCVHVHRIFIDTREFRDYLAQNIKDKETQQNGDNYILFFPKPLSSSDVLYYNGRIGIRRINSAFNISLTGYMHRMLNFNLVVKCDVKKKCIEPQKALPNSNANTISKDELRRKYSNAKNLRYIKVGNQVLVLKAKEKQSGPEPAETFAPSVPDPIKTFAPSVPEPIETVAPSNKLANVTNHPASDFDSSITQNDMHPYAEKEHYTYPASQLNELFVDYCPSKKQYGDFQKLCDLCGDTFTTAISWQKHCLKHQTNSFHRCADCGTDFDTELSLEQHKWATETWKIAIQHGFACPMKDVCVRAVKIHEPKCSICNNPVKAKGKVHGKCRRMLDLTCKICSTQLLSKKTFKRHMRNEHGLPDDNIKDKGPKRAKVDTPCNCEVCGKLFTSKENKHSHFYSVHLEATPFPCYICKRGYTTEYWYNKHLKRHEDLRPFKCTQCDKTYKTNFLLKAHMRHHTGQMSHYCEVCGRGFWNSYKYKIHMRLHTGERPYVCEFCGQGFRSRSRLNDHHSVHSDMRSVMCDVCGKAFKTKKSLKQHHKYCGNTKKVTVRRARSSTAKSKRGKVNSETHHMNLQMGNMEEDNAYLATDYVDTEMEKSHLETDKVESESDDESESDNLHLETDGESETENLNLETDNMSFETDMNLETNVEGVNETYLSTRGLDLPMIL